jgi:hypothetical protein
MEFHGLNVHRSELIDERRSDAYIQGTGTVKYTAAKE